MKQRILLLSVISLLTLTGILLMSTNKKQPPATRLLPASMHSFSTITISTDEKARSILKKLGGTWKVIYPEYLDADTILVESFTSLLAAGQIQKVSFWETLESSTELISVELQNTTGESFSFTLLQTATDSIRLQFKNSTDTYKTNLPLSTFERLASGSLFEKALLPKQKPLSIDIRSAEHFSKRIEAPESTDDIFQLAIFTVLANISTSDLHSRSSGTPYPEEIREDFLYKLYYRYPGGVSITLYVTKGDSITYLYREGDEIVGIQQSTDLIQTLSLLFS